MQVFVKKIFIAISILFCYVGMANGKEIIANSNKENLFFQTDRSIKLKLEIKPADIKTFNKTSSLLEKNNWVDALSWADSIKSEHLKDGLIDYVLWKKYSKLSLDDTENNFSDLLNFIQTHQYLPNINLLKSNAETMYIRKNIPYQFVAEYFKVVAPVSVEAKIKLIKDKISDFEKRETTADNTKDIIALNKEIENDINDAFYNYDFDNNQMQDFINDFGSYLTEKNYIDKIEKLLWKKQYIEADFLISRVSVNYRILYSSIIEISKKDLKYINNILRSIPKELRDNELIQYTRLVYAHKNKDQKEAMNILLSLDKKTTQPDKWWNYQKYYLRELMGSKEYKKAYFLAINQNLRNSSADYAEAEWSAGWIALEFLKRPKDAYYHFYRMYSSVSYPISKSRAAYWAGRAMEANNKIDEAIKWYDIGSKYPLYFYGQLSFHAKNELLGVPSFTDVNPLPTPPIFTKAEEELALNNDIVKIAYLMAKSNDDPKDYTSLFTTAINRAKTKGEMSAIFEIIKNTEDEALVTKMAKYLTYKDVYFVDNLFPILNIINLENPNSHLVHSIIKQESGFHVSASSRVGATGFMQLMPATAKVVAQQMNLRYSEKALRTNPTYNILLGSYYINSLIKLFNGSQILAIASYNAGPTPVNRWIKQNGDPREMINIKDIVNWIESIGYAETRNYVQRIIEGSIVYEYILDKTTDKQKEELQKQQNVKNERENR